MGIQLRSVGNHLILRQYRHPVFEIICTHLSTHFGAAPFHLESRFSCETLPGR